MKIGVVVPAKNEQGHLRQLIESILTLSQISEIIIVEGGSTDQTWQVAKSLAGETPNIVTALMQKSKGKFNAVLEGASVSKSEYIFIWDADGTVSLKDNSLLMEKLDSNYSCIIGDRLRGKIHPGAMRNANFLGNHFFSFIWIPILGFRKMDLLCGSKLLPKRVFLSIPNILKRIDPYGDFSLMATSRLLGLGVRSVPVDYYPRSYGETQIRRWRGGFQLLNTTATCYFLLIYKFAKNFATKR